MPKTPDNIDPRDTMKRPRMPRRAETEVELEGNPDEVKLRRVRSPLGAYLELTEISTTAFSRASGIDHKTVKAYADGAIMPELPKAVWVEVITKGAVPVESWCALPRAKEAFKDLLEKCDPAVREQLDKLPGGGFASPLQRDARGPKPGSKKDREE
jgi:hypothetical protein